MSFASFLRLSLILSLATCSVSCGGGSSSDPTPEDVRTALVSTLGEDGAFTGITKAIINGYALQQIVDAALAGRLQVSGDLQGADGSIITPELTPVGTLRGLRRGEPIQVQIETSIVTVSQDYLNQISVDLNLDAVTVPLTLAEEGYSANQITNITARGDRLMQGTGNLPIVLIDGLGTQIDPLFPRLSVLDIPGISVLPSASPTATPTSTPPSGGGSTEQPSFSVSPAAAVFTHYVGVTSCPQLVTTLHIVNTGDGVIRLQLTPDVSQLEVEQSSLTLDPNQSGDIDVNFNCNSAQPFAGHIPVIGRLFANGQAVGEEKTTIILITPTIIGE